MVDKKRRVEISEPTFLSPIDAQFRLTSKSRYDYSYKFPTTHKTVDEQFTFNHIVGNKEKVLIRKK